jgi:hypothetical protein
LAAIIGDTFFFLRRPMHSASAILDKSIAVLPFDNLSSDKENAYFTDGVRDEILTSLARSVLFPRHLRHRKRFGSCRR